MGKIYLGQQEKTEWRREAGWSYDRLGKHMADQIFYQMMDGNCVKKIFDKIYSFQSTWAVCNLWKFKEIYELNV